MPLFSTKNPAVTTLVLNLGLRDENSASTGLNLHHSYSSAPFFCHSQKWKFITCVHKEYVGLSKSWKQQLKRVYLSIILLFFWLCAWLLLSAVTEQVGCAGNTSYFVFGRCPVLILAGIATGTFLWVSLVPQRKFGDRTFDQAMLASFHTLTISHSVIQSTLSSLSCWQQCWVNCGPG